MEMLLPDWEKKEMNVEKAKEKAQINNLSKFSDNQIHSYTILADSVYHESGNTTIPEYLFIRDLPGRAGGDDGMNMNEKNKIENCRIEPKLKLINMDSVEVEQVDGCFIRLFLMEK